MSGGVHEATGVLTAITIIETIKVKEPSQIIMTFIFCIIGSLIPDIDTLKNNRFKGRICRPLNILLIIFILTLLTYDSNSFLPLLFWLISISLSIYYPHRTFSHSVCALILYCIGIYIGYKQGVISFALGFISHILLDIIDTKTRKVKFLFPLKK